MSGVFTVSTTGTGTRTLEQYVELQAFLLQPTGTWERDFTGFVPQSSCCRREKLSVIWLV